MWRQEDNVGQSVEYPQSDAGRMVTRRDAEDAMHTDLNGEERERTVSVANRTVRPARRATSEGNERSRWSSLAAEVGRTRSRVRELPLGARFCRYKRR